MHQGKLAIISIFGVAVAMGGFAWWHRYQQTRQVMEFWGSDAAWLIRRSKQVEVLRMPPNTRTLADAAPLLKGEAAPENSERRDISKARGLVHVRFALVHERSFEWDATLDAIPSELDLVLRFTDGDKRATVGLDYHRKTCRHLESDKEVSIAPAMPALRKVLEESFPKKEKKETPTKEAENATSTS